MHILLVFCNLFRRYRSTLRSRQEKYGLLMPILVQHQAMVIKADFRRNYGRISIFLAKLVLLHILADL